MKQSTRRPLARPRGDVVRRVIAREWGLDAGLLDKTYLGINSFTWVLTDGADRFVVKWAFPLGEDRDRFPAGLDIAENLDGHGVRTGPPRRTLQADLAVRVRGRSLEIPRFGCGPP